MASPFSFILPRSPQGTGYSNLLRVQGHVFKSETEIPEEYNDDEAETHSPYSFSEYKVEPHDTLFGIALSHNLNPGIIMMDNGLSSDLVYAGQVIKVRTKQRQDLSRKGSVEQSHGLTLNGKGECITESGKEEEGSKLDQEMLNELDVFYNTSVGDVEGRIKVDDSIITFVPKGILEKNPLTIRKQLSMPLPGSDIGGSGNEDKLLNFITCIDVRDIDECNVMAVPNPNCDEMYEVNKEFAKDYLLQIMLKYHGGKSMGKYFDSLIADLRKKNVSYACVYFKVHSKQDSQREFPNKVKHKMVLELQNAILAVKSTIQDSQEGISKTRIPYFEFLYEKFDSKDGELLRKAVKKSTMNDRKTLQDQEVQSNKPSGSRGFFGRRWFTVIKKMTGTLKLVDDSQTLTKDQFGELTRCIPQLYQTLEWQLVYSNKLHGTSFTNMMRKTANASPLIIVIQDEHGFSFGAYASHRLKLSQNYYGNGETFLFTFRDLEDISVFNWSRKNSMFIHVSESGVMFGAGPQYGLWINNELTKGRSYKCDTFDNPVLSLENEFQIIRIEIWTAIDAVHSARVVKHTSIL